MGVKSMDISPDSKYLAIVSLTDSSGNDVNTLYRINLETLSIESISPTAFCDNNPPTSELWYQCVNTDYKYTHIKYAPDGKNIIVSTAIEKKSYQGDDVWITYYRSGLFTLDSNFQYSGLLDYNIHSSGVYQNFHILSKWRFNDNI